MEKTCPKCKSIHNKKGVFCSRKCANSREWSEEHKKKVSKICKQSEKVKLANSNPEKKRIISEAVKKQGILGLINYNNLHTEEARKKTKLTIIEKRKKRLLSEDYQDKVQYRKNCQFYFHLNEYPDEFDFSLIKKYGWYSAPNKGGNTNGISRDHMYSISDGWKNKVSPLIISHPANCKLLRHDDNFFIKNKNSSISLEDLEKRIKEWNKKYKECKA